MVKYLVKRIVLAIPVVIGVTVAVFIIIRLIPGTAVDLRIESASVTQEQREALKKELGVDKPVAVQYLIWVGGLARGDLGNSLRSQRPVADRIKTAVPVSVEIAILALIATVVIENLAGGMGTAAFVALVMSLCDHRFTATQFALLTSLESLNRIWLGVPAAKLVEALDWGAFFFVTVLASLPGLWVVWRLRAHLGQDGPAGRGETTPPCAAGTGCRP